MNDHEKTLSTTVIHRGKITEYVIKEVELANGQKSSREVVLHDDAVGILALKDDRTALFVKQFRTAINQSIYEIPAGLIDTGEQPLQAAKRELQEETGYQANQWEEIAGFYTSAGFTDEFMTVFLAHDVEKVSEQLDLDVDEVLQVEELSFDQAMDKYQQGLMPDAKTVVALMYWSKRLA